MADWVEAGKKAPLFTLASDGGGKVRLADELGSPIVIYFYPKDDTPGCTVEACAFRDASKKLTKLGAKVYGISPDTAESHDKFRDKFDLNFPLLAEPDLKVAEKYGASGEKNLFGKKSMCIRRSTIIIDATGKVHKMWKSVKVAGHDEKVLAVLKEM